MAAQESGQKLTWWDSANCIGADPELFIIQKLRNLATEAAAKRICAQCVAREGCIDYAMTHIDDVDMQTRIWGGKTPLERLYQ